MRSEPPAPPPPDTDRMYPPDAPGKRDWAAEEFRRDVRRLFWHRREQLFAGDDQRNVEALVDELVLAYVRRRA